jgi:L-ascorbate metabolism protein UlaG (beta-lactamase superfamily)
VHLEKVKITYLDHSGFAVETENHLLIFDYFKDESEKGHRSLSNGVVGEEDLKIHKDVIVFSSHSHGDHFNPVILKWRFWRPDIEYVLSDDIELEEEVSNVNFMGSYEEIDLKAVKVKSYGSTDIGLSFMVYVDGINIFHAGDLNWWYWWDDTAEEIEKADRSFKEEVEKILGEKIDIAFFPVDPRLEHNYSKGGLYFIEKLKPKYLVPMHFWGNFDVCSKFKSEAGGASTEVMEIRKRGQSIFL